MDIVLGLDQGRTKTAAAIADLSGRILAVGTAGGGHHYLLGMDHAICQMKTAAKQAADAAGLGMEDIVAVGGGLAGADLPHDCKLLSDAVEEGFSCPDVVVNDCIIALRAETKKEQSIIICAGTGLNFGIWGTDGSQSVLGYYIDELWHGGEAIGRKSLFAVMESAIGVRPETILTDKLLHFYGVDDVLTLREYWVKGNLDKGKIKDFAIEVVRGAEAGDEVCVSLLKEFADAWAKYAVAGMKLHDMQNIPVDIYISGSIFKSATDIMLAELTKEIRKANPEVRLHDARYEPIVGGVILALEKKLGCSIPEDVLKNVYASAETLGLVRSEEKTDEA